MSKKRNAARKAGDFSKRQRTNNMDYLHSSTQDSVCQQSSNILQLQKTAERQAFRREAKENGWKFGAKMLSFSLTKACRILHEAGLSAWIDGDKAIYGPVNETKQAITALANAGDAMSQIVLEKFGEDILGEAHE